MQTPICLSTLGSETLRYISDVDSLTTTDEVLDNLNLIANETCQINVLGALMLPLHHGDWESLEKGKTVFLHKSVPRGWWEEHMELSRAHPGFGMSFALLSLAPFTMSELMRALEPLAADRWPFEVALKHGMRDRLNCPVGGRWLISYWSRSVMSMRLNEGARAILFMAATFAAIRLQKLLGPQVVRIGKGAMLTPRELAVLRLLSLGNQVSEIARLLDLGEETIRSHVKKAQAKLGVRTQAHAVAQALRRRLIP
ncbi:LuxR C-terminal-related transcriptional regulator [Hyphomicrobium sp. LHD-15]|uniref:helix-turn-helix transcriptional regulator n=1 Tax=Hyphomicrobium sp. LHD-15 TaxID=3072142 RepID=UPI00280E9751|nr:LuxR C-terminal-related transcriptional regulator [Hyphomicrobium sp. LHD-15]MDQ8700056.1 LuxR C-terminal-related transcriptional regulator [Hyphomicrobium sp. LHD-15]